MLLPKIPLLVRRGDRRYVAASPYLLMHGLVCASCHVALASKDSKLSRGRGGEFGFLNAKGIVESKSFKTTNAEFWFH